MGRFLADGRFPREGSAEAPGVPVRLTAHKYRPTAIAPAATTSRLAASRVPRAIRPWSRASSARCSVDVRSGQWAWPTVSSFRPAELPMEPPMAAPRMAATAPTP